MAAPRQPLLRWLSPPFSMTRLLPWCRSAALWVGAVLVIGEAPAGAQTFIGRNFAGSTSLVTIPPDTMGAVGIDYFVELNNALFRVYRKSDGGLAQGVTATQFWTAAGAAPISRSVDPRIVYDPHARRWYASAMDNPPNPNSFLFAISSSDDPTQPWTGFKIDSDTDNSNFADFPMLAYNGEGVFIASVMPQVTAPDSRTAFLVFPKADLLQPLPSIANKTQFEDVPQTTAGPVPQLAIDASNTFGTLLPVVSMSTVGGGTLVRANITPPGSPAIVNVGSTVIGGAQPPTVDQPGPKQNIEANDWRFSSNAVLHKGQIYAVQAVDDQSAIGRAAVRFLRIDATTNSILENTILLDPASRAMTFPSIAVNDFGDVVVGATGTSTTEFASSYALVGHTTAGGVTNFNTPLLLQAGVSDYERLGSTGLNRWGDYSATTVDPADPGIFWTTQEYVSSTNNWSTQVTELTVLQPNEARWANQTPLGNFDDPTMWQTSHGGAPLPAENVVISRATDPSGVATMTVFFPPQPVGVYVIQSASIRQGNLSINLGGNQWDLAKQLDVGPYYGHPQVTISNGTINSLAGFIANRPTADGNLHLDNVHWTVSGDLIVGSSPAPGASGILPGAIGGAGSLTIDNNSQLGVGSTLQIWKRGIVNLSSGVLTAATIQHNHGGKFNFTGGTLHVGSFQGELVNAGGTLAPGNSVGTTNVALLYDQHLGGKLSIELSGNGPGQFDQLIVGGPATLNGTIDVSLIGGFVASSGQTFTFLTAAGGILGSFATGVFPTLSDRMWHLVYQPNAVQLAVTVAGDYNRNGVVDGADYVVWRHMLGQSGAGLAADGNANNQIDTADYGVWRAHFGRISPGSGAGVDANATVPEPATLVLFMIAAPGWCLHRRRAASNVPTTHQRVTYVNNPAI